MIIGQIKDGIVLDHITAGKGIKIYDILGLQEIGCTVAMIQLADSKKMGKKDIIKIGKVIDLDFDILGFIDPGITVNIIQDGKLAKREHLSPPEKIVNLIKCKNPRCITSCEQGIKQEFYLADREKLVYRCKYCDTEAPGHFRTED